MGSGKKPLPVSSICIYKCLKFCAIKRTETLEPNVKQPSFYKIFNCAIDYYRHDLRTGLDEMR